MSEFALNVKTDNAAFEDAPEELSRILREVADKVQAGYGSGVIFDVNGNRVGEFSA